VRLIYLVSDPALVSGDLKGIAAFADGIGAETRLLVPVNADGSLGVPTDLVTRAHAAGLLVHAWTVRLEPVFLPAGYHGSVVAQFEQLRAIGVDGVFTDFPDIGATTYKNP
jgi:glycerophosphoryl diester phosphodiesterase